MKTLPFLLLALVFSVTSALAIIYPYAAPVERQKLIRTRSVAIKPGMSSKEVIAILENPDETTRLYEPKVKKPLTIGTTMWYIVSQQKEHGSQNEIKKIALAIRLDLKDNVTRVDRFNL